MSYELDAMCAQMNRLERQLRILKIAAVILAVLAVIMALASRPAAQQVSETLRVKQLIVEDAQGRARVVLGALDAPGNDRLTDFTQTPALIRRYGLVGEEVLRPTQ